MASVAPLETRHNPQARVEPIGCQTRRMARVATAWLLRRQLGVRAARSVPTPRVPANLAPMPSPGVSAGKPGLRVTATRPAECAVLEPAAVEAPRLPVGATSARAARLTTQVQAVRV